MMPYDITKKSDSMDHALQMANEFGFINHIYDIKPATDAAMIPDGSSILVGCKIENIAMSRINLRPRERTKYLYQYAQIHNLLVVGTGNLSERLMGYFTKWADGVSDFNPIGMLTKREIYILAHYLKVPIIIIKKAPSAELFDGQTDEVELGMKYDQIDDFILLGSSGDDEINQKIIRRIIMTEHKRNMPPIYVG
jgi:NAD+ synthetase